jgi:branched-chain amino acid transport system substrate-binding protein
MTCRWVVGACVAALALWGGPAGPALAAGEVTIALFTPLTGSQADLGAFNKNAVEMAVEDVNAAGGIRALGGARLRLATVDSTSDPATDVAAAQRLVTTKIIAAVGMGIGRLTIPVQPVFERAQIPLLVHSIAPTITTSGFAYTFRIAPTGTQFGQTQVEFVRSLNSAHHLGLTRAAVIYENSAYGASRAEPIKAQATDAGVDLVLFESYPHGLTDASSIVTEVRRADAQVLFPVGHTTDAELIINAMALQRVHPLIIGGGGEFIWPAMGKDMGDKINGLTSVASWNWDSTHIKFRPSLWSIVMRYEKKYGTFMPEHSGMAYAEVWAVVEAIGSVGSADPAKIKDALHTLDFSRGPMTLMQPGRVKFDAHGQNIYAHPVMVQWEGGAPHTVYPPEDASRQVEVPK